MTDWDDEFANSAHIPGSDELPARWVSEAASFRTGLSRFDADIPYGPSPHQRLDLIRPESAAHGLVVFVHGGYWMETGKSDWTHLAAGALRRGWAVALPGYPLAPDATVAAITHDIADAITAVAAMADGPIRLAGHSAGGHLVTRMVCADTPLPAPVLKRVTRVTSISGLHDLRLLRRTAMNDALRLTKAEARAESPALHDPVPGTRLSLWVGAAERPQFLRQSRLMALVWDGLADISLTEQPGHNHYSILDGLSDPESPLMTELLR